MNKPPKTFEVDWNKRPAPAPEPPTPLPCDHEIFEHGDQIAAIHGPRAFTIEDWIVKVREKCSQRVDWHFVGGIARIVYIGDRDKVVAAIYELADELIAAYMTCEHNHIDRAPERTDVSIRITA
jgi:hypothetical protein